jgi:lia operon protein LiaG
MINNHRLKKISLILAGTALICLGLAVMLFLNIDVKDYNSNKYMYSINEEKSFNISEIKDIDINSFSSDINLINTNDNKVKVHIYGKLYAKNRDNVNEPVIELNNGKLEVKQNRRNKTYVGLNFNVFWFNKNDVRIDVFIPKAYREDMSIDSSSGNIKTDTLDIKSLKVDTFSGKITLDDVTSGTINIDTSSGDITAGSLKAKDVEIKSFSGKFRSKALETDKLEVSSSSGEVSLGLVKAVDVVLDTFSGKINAEGFEANNAKVSSSSGKVLFNSVNAGKFTCETFSGDVLMNKGALKNASIETSSGKVALKLDAGSEFSLDAESSSGNVVCEIPVDTVEKQEKNVLKGSVGKSENKIGIETFSGDISISRE